MEAFITLDWQGDSKAAEIHLRDILVGEVDQAMDDLKSSFLNLTLSKLTVGGIIWERLFLKKIVQTQPVSTGLSLPYFNPITALSHKTKIGYR